VHNSIFWHEKSRKKQGTPVGFPHAFGAAPPPATRPLGAAKLIHKSKNRQEQASEDLQPKVVHSRPIGPASWQAITDLRPNKSSDTGKSMVNWDSDLLTNVPDRLGCVF